jgi:hypothetical protein
MQMIRTLEFWVGLVVGMFAMAIITMGDHHNALIAFLAIGAQIVLFVLSRIYWRNHAK